MAVMCAFRFDQQFEFLIDEEDVEMVGQYDWHIQKAGYLRAYIGQYQHVLLHRLLLGLTDRKQQVDHINGNKLDNRRENLRITTQQQNSWNMGRRRGKQYRGVHKRPDTEGRWVAAITVNRKTILVGAFTTEEDAARAWDHAARQHFGEHARLNFPEDNGPPPERVTKKKTSKYPGLFWDKSLDRWVVRLVKNQKRKYIGVFQDEEEAAIKLREVLEQECPERLEKPRYRDLPKG